MKTKLLILALWLLTGISAVYAAAGDTFSAKNSSGQTLYYRINDDEATVSVTKAPTGKSYSGSLVVPIRTDYKGVTYNVSNVDELAFYGSTGLTSVNFLGDKTELGS